MVYLKRTDGRQLRKGSNSMRLVDYLMGKPLYIGFRVEVANRFLTSRNLVKKYNTKHKQTQIFDLHKDGKITVEKENGMLIARGATPDKGSTGLVNFSGVSSISFLSSSFISSFSILNLFMSFI